MHSASAPFEESQAEAEEWKDQDELEFEEAQDEYDEDLSTFRGGVSKALSLKWGLCEQVAQDGGLMITGDEEAAVSKPRC